MTMPTAYEVEMRRQLNPMDPEAFWQLVTRCGLELQEIDLAQLARRKLVVPWTPPSGERCYTAWHLYVVAEYLEAVRPARHPWATRTAERRVEEIGELNEKVNQVLSLASRGGAAAGGDWEELLAEVERFLARINPFGPLADVFDLLRPELVAQMRNDGRLYLAVKGAADAVARQLYGAPIGDGDDEEPKTRPMFGIEPPEEREPLPASEADILRSTQVIGDEEQGTTTAARKAMDAVVDAASAEAPDRGEGSEDVDEEAYEEEEQRDTDILPAAEAPQGLGGQESSEPIVLVAEQEEEEGQQADPDGGIDGQNGPQTQQLSLEARIAELNERRQAYMKEQAWDELAALYEEGIDLFSEANERRQIFVSLAKLYEIKLGDRKRAFSAYTRAWAAGDGLPGDEAVLLSLLRLGLEIGLDGPFTTWLADEFEDALDGVAKKGASAVQIPAICEMLTKLRARQPNLATVQAIDAFLAEHAN